MGKGASIMSIKGWGKIGTKAKHHLKGYNKELKPRTAEESKFYFPTNITDFSNITAASNYKNTSNLNREKSWGQNHLLSI